ncbi:hypothetical protein EDD86DRAFT_248571 [Gorgonomyces haynaldii]|nr:hypothetical protein EDD86DRAFT_248571 [Gorgonomyces haynaldii]
MDLDDLLDEFEISSQEPKSQPKQPDKTKTNRDDLDDLLDEIQIDTLPKLFKKPSGSSQRCLNLVSCTHLKCLQCDFQCQYFDGFEWTTVEYLTFRNHFPDRQKLRQYLKPLKGYYSYSFPDFTQPLDYVAFAVVILSIIVYFGCILIQLPRLRKGKFYAKYLVIVFAFCLVYSCIKLVYVYTDSPPIVHCFYGITGMLAIVSSVLLDGELLKCFCAVSTRLTRKTVAYLQLGMAGATYIRLGFLGSPFPSWLKIWYNYFTGAYTIIVLLYEQWQLYMIITLARHRIIESRSETVSMVSMQDETAKTVHKPNRDVIHAENMIMKRVITLLVIMVLSNTFTIINPIFSSLIFDGIQKMTLGQ